MPIPIPGQVDSGGAATLVAAPAVFTATLATPNSIFYKGIRMECFYLPESVGTADVDVGDMVSCLYVEEVQQIFVLNKIVV